MKMFSLNNIKTAIKNLDFFELGNSFVFYFILMFGIMPLAAFFRLPSKYVEYFINQDISIFNAKIFTFLLIGILFFILGYKFFNFQRTTEKISQIFKKEWSFKRTLRVFLIVFFFGFIIKSIKIFSDGYSHIERSQNFVNSPFYSLIGLLDWLGPTALAIAFIYYFYLFKIGDLRYKIWKFIALSVFIFEFGYGFFSSSRFSAIIPIMIYLITRHYVYRRDFRRTIIIIVLILFVLMPIQNFYRTPQNLFAGYSVLTNHHYKTTSLSVSQYAFDSSIARISQSWILSAIFEKNDEFLYGQTFKEFLTSFGPPRFIWKNKPLSINHYGNEFGRHFGILNSDDFVTSIGPTIIGDWYMNFGLPGIIFGMLFFGAIFRFIYDCLIKNTGGSFSGVIIYSVIWIQIIKGTEDFIAPVWAGLVKLLVILIVIHFALATKKK